jgi:hypothetical protein
MERPFCPKCGEIKDNTEKCIRDHPDEAALLGLGAGFLLAQLPLRFLAAAVIRAVVMVLKPAALLYGLFRLAEDFHAQRSGPPNERPVV